MDFTLPWSWSMRACILSWFFLSSSAAKVSSLMDLSDLRRFLVTSPKRLVSASSSDSSSRMRVSILIMAFLPPLRALTRHVSSLGLNDGKGGERAPTHGVRHLGGSLKETGVKVEHISGVSLTAGGTPEQKGHLPVSHSLLGQVVEDDDSVHTVVPEVLSHGDTGLGGEVLQGGGVRGSGRHHHGVAHGVSVGETLHNLGHG